MKSVLISIRPQWCEKIARGEKTIEVRKNKPKLDTPFKCYIYMTKGFASYPVGNEMWCHNNGGMVVIGEFLCDRIYQYASYFFRSEPLEGTDISTEDMTRLSCLTAKELYEYEHSAEPKENCINLIGLYGWHISKLKIYDTPKGLSDFRIPCREYEKDYPQCGSCDFYHSMGEYPAECGCDGKKPVIRPPQSWCYVKGGEGDG